MDSEEAELWKKYQLTRDILRSPLELTEHEDGKAGRILAPIAFLTAAATSLFAAFLNNDIKLEFDLFSLRVDLIVTFYQVFVISIIIGTLFMLEAFGPYFVYPKAWPSFRKKQDNRNKKQEPESLFFFDKIAKMNIEDWTKYFEKDLTEIISKACQDNVFEAHLVSEKVKKKVHYMKIGKFFFYLAMIMLLALTMIGTHAYVIK